MSRDAMTERKKAQLCAQWLCYCLSIGWKQSDLARLTDLFWKLKGWETFAGWKP